MILVTGSTGLLGSHLLYDLVSSGKQVTALKRSFSDLSNTQKIFNYYSSDGATLFSKIKWVDADVLDFFSLTDNMAEDTELYHCAAMVSFNKKDHALMYKINVQGTANVVNAALEKKVKKLCYVSSIAALGRNKKNANQVTESTFWESSKRNSMYAISKYSSEREVWRGIQEGLNTVIVNPSLIIGPGNWNRSSSSMFYKAYKGIKYYTGGITGFIDVRDVSALMIKLMNSNIHSEQFILSSENLSYRDFFDKIHLCFNKPQASVRAGKLLSSLAWRIEAIRSKFLNEAPLITRETANAAHQVNYFSNKKIKELFDYGFISIDQSVKDTCNFFLNDIQHKTS